VYQSSKFECSLFEHDTVLVVDTCTFGKDQQWILVGILNVLLDSVPYNIAWWSVSYHYTRPVARICFILGCYLLTIACLCSIEPQAIQTSKQSLLNKTYTTTTQRNATNNPSNNPSINESINHCITSSQAALVGIEIYPRGRNEVDQPQRTACVASR
jgi:hypothetical protein